MRKLISYYISANQLAKFAKATIAGKKSIIRDQKKPNKFLIPWYQKAKGAIKKLFGNIDNHEPINDAIEYLKSKIPQNDRQRIDIRSSIDALLLMKQIKLPGVLNDMQYKLITTDSKGFTLNGVEVKVAPEIIIYGECQNKKVVGAVKVHICKGKPFDYDQCGYVSLMIYKYLKTQFTDGSEVMPELCLCLDVFSKRVVCLPDNIEKINKELEQFCEEIKVLWNVA